MALHRALTRVYVNDTIYDAGDIFEYDGKALKNTEIVGAADAKKQVQDEAARVPLKVGMERGIDEKGSGALVKPHDPISHDIKSQEQIKELKTSGTLVKSQEQQRKEAAAAKK